jgi:hypothetical protein
LKKVREAAGEIASAQLFSAVTKAGIDEARARVIAMLQGRRAGAAIEQ